MPLKSYINEARKPSKISEFWRLLNAKYYIGNFETKKKINLDRTMKKSALDFMLRA